MRDAGIAPLDVLRWATVHGAELMGRGHELGRVADRISRRPPRGRRRPEPRRHRAPRPRQPRRDHEGRRVAQGALSGADAEPSSEPSRPEDRPAVVNLLVHDGRTNADAFAATLFELAARRRPPRGGGRRLARVPCATRCARGRSAALRGAGARRVSERGRWRAGSVRRALGRGGGRGRRLVEAFGNEVSRVVARRRAISVECSRRC